MLYKKPSQRRRRRPKKKKKKKKRCHYCPNLQSNRLAAPSAYLLPQRRSKMLKYMRQNLLWINNQSPLRLKNNQRRRAGLDSLARKGLKTIAASKKRKKRRSSADLKSGQK